MNKQAHTPGPWHYEERSGMPASCYGRFCVGASFYSKPGVSDGRDSVCDQIGGDHAAANAALIAAAPDLLAALKELVALDAEPNTFAKRGGSYWTNAIVNAMRAIAKATGEQQ